MKQTTLSAVQEALQSAPVGILLIDEKGTIQWHNDTLAGLLEIHQPLTGKNTTTLESELRAVLIDPPETILLQRGHNQRWLRCHRQQGEEKSVVLFYMDVTAEQELRHERDQLSEDLQQLTTRDPITGLPNRHALLQGLEPLISRSRRYGNPLSLIKLQATIEGIDTPSEEEAQRCWQLVALLLKEHMRWADIIGRYDGADFLLVLPETPDESARQLAEKLCKLISENHVRLDKGQSHRIKPYCGITGWGKGDDATLMLKRLDHSVSAARAADRPIAA